MQSTDAQLQRITEALPKLSENYEIVRKHHEGYVAAWELWRVSPVEQLSTFCLGAKDYLDCTALSDKALGPHLEGLSNFLKVVADDWNKHAG